MDIGTPGTILLGCTFGKESHRWRSPWISQYSGARFEFCPEVQRKPLEDFMQVREIIKFKATKSVAGTFQNLTQCVIKKMRLSNIRD